MHLKRNIFFLLLSALLLSSAGLPEASLPWTETAAAGEKVADMGQNEDILDEKSMAPDFTLPNADGGEFTLSSLRGQYVILDFWGTWCGWCIKGMPKLKEYYEKYRGKFEVVGVDCGDVTAKWKAALKVLDLPWTNVQVGRDNGVSRQYNVKSFPTKVIIDPQGYIVKISVGEDPRFYTTLDKMFK